MFIMSRVSTLDMEPPPASQSHFAKFEDFIPDDGAAFEEEFGRLASSHEFTRQRTIAMREELKLHYFSQEAAELSDIEEGEDEEDGPETKVTTTTLDLAQLKLLGFQKLCEKVGLPAYPTLAECRRQLKTKLVNIIDFIDAHRTAKKVEIWDDFQAFSEYTWQPEHRIDKKEAKEGDGILSGLLQRLAPRKGGRGRGDQRLRGTGLDRSRGVQALGGRRGRMAVPAVACREAGWYPDGSSSRNRASRGKHRRLVFAERVQFWLSEVLVL